MKYFALQTIRQNQQLKSGRRCNIFFYVDNLILETIKTEIFWVPKSMWIVEVLTYDFKAKTFLSKIVTTHESTY